MTEQKTVVVIGNGMVGQRFCEELVEHDAARQYRMVTFCEEPRAAYDRVGLTSFFAHRDAEQLMLAKMEWYTEHGIALHIGDRASQIDRNARTVRSEKGVEIAYHVVVLANRIVSIRPHLSLASINKASLSTAPSKTCNTSSPTAQKSNALPSLAEGFSAWKRPKQHMISDSTPMSSSPHHV